MTRTWTDDTLLAPHAVPDKAKRVRDMFTAIAGRYDLNNRLHSMWRDQAWRRAAVRMAKLQPGDDVLDVATGTGDLAMHFRQAGAKRVIGVDFTFDMLPKAVKKAKLGHYAAGDAMRLPLPDASVDVVSIAFGIRNVADPDVALREFARVLRPGGRLVILEFTVPCNRLFRAGFNVYFKHIMPFTCGLISGRPDAYRYLASSVNTFISRDEMVAHIQSAGFQPDVTTRTLDLGIACLYRATV